MNKTYKINEPHVISEAMDDELVVINLESGCYYSLDQSATLIWSKLNLGYTAEKIQQFFNPCDSLDTSIEIEIYVSYLLDEELITLAGNQGTSPETPEDLAVTDFKKPTVQKFTDMQEMLLLDPIHEVSDMGWPHESK